MKLLAVGEADVLDVERLMAQREMSVNRQLGAALFFSAMAFATCLVCSLTRVFLTGRMLGVVAFLPGVLLQLSGTFVSRRFDGGERPRPWVKYYLCTALALAIYILSLIQLVWAVPLIIGGLAFVYSYMNLRMVVIYNTLTLAFLVLGAGMNALWGMPNPDMLPYPTDVQGVQDGYITLWAMAHREAWSQWEYFLRILRFHTLPMVFLILIVAGCGYTMVRHAQRKLVETLRRVRRVREVEACLLLMAGGMQSEELIRAVLNSEGAEDCRATPLTQEFVDSIPAQEIPALMREFRERNLSNADFAELSAHNPEAALKLILATDSHT